MNPNNKLDAIVIIGVSLSSCLPNLVKECNERGLAVVLVSENRYTPDMANYHEFIHLYQERTNMADILFEEKSLTEGKILQIIQKIRETCHIKAIIASVETYVEITAKINAVLGLQGPGAKAAFVSRNKILQRMLLEQHGFHTPDYMVTDSEADVSDFIDKHKTAVIKLHNRSASFGVKKVSSREELSAYLEEFDGQTYLIEQYIKGREVSVECIVQDQQIYLFNITSKGKGEEPYFVETMQLVPAGIENRVSRQLYQLAKDLIEINEMCTGILHLEVMIEDSTEKLYTVEYAVREPGHNILDLINWRFNESALGLYMDAMLGSRIDYSLEEKKERMAVTAYVDFPEGEIVEILQRRSLLEIEGVKEFDFFGKPGDTVKRAESNYDPIAAIIIFAENEDELRATLDEIDDAFTVKIQTASGLVNATLTEKIRQEVAVNSTVKN
ncbi:ATP-grasp domain-containing protein [Brevibacillus ruminantium]|uniref:ATP-grasp domain-containing protein n=1 Tax=Brevibacillus ruminantium TaxID=2950604 RepID=A0ABY4WBP1_9BACL|nr:ATP-grasp domain-containing protein [Brevibacillus ruminantium]USG64602.1 ATP-grasp domain-containing protein [Brevibacillus ruminantium]